MCEMQFHFHSEPLTRPESTSDNVQEFCHGSSWTRGQRLPTARAGSSIAVAGWSDNGMHLRVYYQAPDLTLREHCWDPYSWSAGKSTTLPYFFLGNFLISILTQAQVLSAQTKYHDTLPSALSGGITRVYTCACTGTTALKILWATNTITTLGHPPVPSLSCSQGAHDRRASSGTTDRGSGFTTRPETTISSRSATTAVSGSRARSSPRTLSAVVVGGCALILLLDGFFFFCRTRLACCARGFCQIVIEIESLNLKANNSTI
jgi:hypothetical protein